jgi:hypothetical protein
MKVCFAFNNLTYFKYYCPIIELLRYEKDIELIICYHRDNSKYNGLKDDKNYEIFKNILSSLNPVKIIPMTDSKIKCQVLFTVETVDRNRFEFRKHFAVPNGFDYVTLAKRAISETTYLVSSMVYGLDLQERHKVKFEVPPLPVVFSNIQKQIDFAKNQTKTNKKIAFIFFPEVGFIRLVKRVIKYLKKKEFFVIIKQRKKSQLVPINIGADLIVYDEIWYPSESIFYPLISKLVIGFGTGAYTDLCEVGIPFIDNAAPKYTRRGGFYLKPSLKNFWYIDKRYYRNTKKIIDQISSNSYHIKIVHEDLVKKYYLNLIKR